MVPTQAAITYTKLIGFPSLSQKSLMCSCQVNEGSIVIVKVDVLLMCSPSIDNGKLDLTNCSSGKTELTNITYLYCEFVALVDAVIVKGVVTMPYEGIVILSYLKSDFISG